MSRPPLTLTRRAPSHPPAAPEASRRALCTAAHRLRIGSSRYQIPAVCSWPAGPRPTGAGPGAAVGTVRASEREEISPPRSDDWLSGGQYSQEVLSSYELGNASFGPRVFTLFSFVLLLSAALPSSLGDAVRGGLGDGQALGVLGGNLALVAALSFLIKADVDSRASKLKILARELALGDMRIVSKDKLGNERLSSLRELRRSYRVALLYGTRDSLADAIQGAVVYRRRLAASRILVIPVLSDASQERVEPSPGNRAFPAFGGRWMAWPTPSASGFDAAEYFRDILGTQSASSGTGKEGGAYITLGIDGRVRGSGEGIPTWDVLLSTFPQQLLDRAGLEVADDKDRKESAEAKEAMQNDDAVAIVAVHEEFYKALAVGDKSSMGDLWRSPAAQSAAIADYEQRGAKVDGWEVVLREDRRPVGMKISDVDVSIQPCGTLATLTCIETVGNGSTLLATQSYVKDPQQGKWSITSHNTIPYGKDIIAKIALRCDANGCVALPARAIASSASAASFKLK